MKLAAQKIAREQRRGERRRLGVLLQWIAAHVVAQRTGERVSEELLAEREAALAALLGEIATAGHLLFFGIRDAGDLGEPPVQLYPVLDPRWPIGTLALDLPPLVEWITGGAMRGAGWRRAAELTADDL